MTVSWMKVGTESVATAQAEQAAAAARNEQRGTAWRFFMAKGEENVRITFVDGDLIQTEAGLTLAPPRFYEHGLMIQGKVQNYVCPQATSPGQGYKCPICATGDSPSLVAVFTIIDHRSYTGKSKDGQPGKVYKDQRKLFVAKSQTMEQLVKIAVKRGGLSCATFDVERLGENSAGVGSMFDFVEKNELSVLKGAFQEEVVIDNQKVVQTIFTPLDYEKEIKFRTPEELAALGLAKFASGSAISPGGSAAPYQKPGLGLGKSSNYEDKL